MEEWSVTWGVWDEGSRISLRTLVSTANGPALALRHQCQPIRAAAVRWCSWIKLDKCDEDLIPKARGSTDRALDTGSVDEATRS
jgi:hypothetical protein